MVPKYLKKRCRRMYKFSIPNRLDYMYLHERNRTVNEQLTYSLRHIKSATHSTTTHFRTGVCDTFDYGTFSYWSLRHIRLRHIFVLESATHSCTTYKYDAFYFSVYKISKKVLWS